MLQTGTKAPEFSLPDQDGKLHTLSEIGRASCRERVSKSV